MRLATLLVALLAAAPAVAQERLVMVDGRAMHVLVSGTEHLGKAPVVVLEWGGGGIGVEGWATVQAEIAKVAPVISYDRAGFGTSEPDGVAPQPRYVAEKLHRLLGAAGLPEPYVMVGISWGGPIIRMFAALYPAEVAGMVYLDPTDLRTRVQEIEFLMATGYTQDGAAAKFQNYRDEFAGYVRTFSGAARAEMEVIDAVELADAPEFRALPPVPRVPVSVLLAGKLVEGMWAGRPCAPQACRDRWLPFRERWLRSLLSAHPRSRMTVVPESGHIMTADVPGIVGAEIRYVLTNTVLRQ